MKKLKSILFTVAFPIVAYIIMEILCSGMKNRHVLGSLLDIKTLIRNSGISALMAFALSFNLTCGRFDLSLGAQRLAGTICGGILALSLGLTGVWLLIFALIFGMLFGLATGLAFITLRVPPMVLGIGFGLIWECVPYIASQGKGLNLFGQQGIDILSNTTFTVIVVLIFAAIVTVLLSSTKFGYQMRAIQGSQLIARNSGINIFKHAALCYMFAGGFVCVASIIEAAFTTQLSSTMGLASNGPVVANMFAMMLGGYIGTRSNEPIGIIVGAFTIKLIGQGLTTLELSEANANLANMVLFVLFLIFLTNKDYFKKKRAEADRIRAAQEKKKAMGIV